MRWLRPDRPAGLRLGLALLFASWATLSAYATDHLVGPAC
jgi:hypothetical protein